MSTMVGYDRRVHIGRMERPRAADALRRLHDPLLVLQSDAVSEDRRTATERLVAESLEDPRSSGRPFSSRTRETRRSLEHYLRAGVRPRWMDRLIEIERGMAHEHRRLGEAYEALRTDCGEDLRAFARRWRAVARSWRFDDLNELIRTHNEWYPVERDLPMDLRTRDYVLINGRSYRRRELGPDWVLERFPA
jgi:hypothetical protein